MTLSRGDATASFGAALTDEEQMDQITGRVKVDHLTTFVRGQKATFELRREERHN
jgi:hypothetical protein